MAKELNSTESKECFIIMPISEVDGYEPGHFNHVYEDIIKPACIESDFKPIRADEVKETNLIHLDLLKKLIDAPIAICDLSTRNPNVLFELGIRQAFDKPVVLIQEKGTPKIFDIAPLRYLEYSKDMKYHEVIQTQQKLKETILATKAAEGQNGNINSIVKLMSLSSPAIIPNLDSNSKEAFAVDVLQAQMNDIRKMIEMSMLQDRKNGRRNGSIALVEYERISNKFDEILNLPRTGTRAVDPRMIEKNLSRLMRDAEEVRMHCENGSEERMFMYLLEKMHRTIREIE